MSEQLNDNTNNALPEWVKDLREEAYSIKQEIKEKEKEKNQLSQQYNHYLKLSDEVTELKSKLKDAERLTLRMMDFYKSITGKNLDSAIGPLFQAEMN